MRQYANAKKVLPEELYEKVKEHFTGLLYVPGDRSYDPGKREIVISLAKQGADTAEIANIMALSIRRVNQLLEGKRKRKTSMEWVG